MESKDRDIITIINKFDNFTTFSWRRKKIVLPYNVPVEVDFTDDPDMISQLLQCPQLQICTKKELAAYDLRTPSEPVGPTFEKSVVEEIVADKTA